MEVSVQGKCEPDGQELLAHCTLKSVFIKMVSLTSSPVMPSASPVYLSLFCQFVPALAHITTTWSNRAKLPWHDQRCCARSKADYDSVTEGKRHILVAVSFQRIFRGHRMTKTPINLIFSKFCLWMRRCSSKVMWHHCLFEPLCDCWLLLEKASAGWVWGARD